VPQESKQASSQAAWALLTQGVTSARLEAHRLRHLLSRAQKLVEGSKHKDHLYQVAGDIILSVPDRLQRLETMLDRTSLALSGMGEEFLSARLPISEKQLVEDATTPAFGGGQHRHSIEWVVQAHQERQAQAPGGGSSPTDG